MERSKGYVPKSVKINRWDMYREMARLKDFEGMGFAPVEVTRAETAAAKAQRLAAQRVMFASAFPSLPPRQPWNLRASFESTCLKDGFRP